MNFLTLRYRLLMVAAFVSLLISASLSTVPFGGSQASSKPQQLRGDQHSSVKPAVRSRTHTNTEQLLAIDDGDAEGSYGGSGNPGFGWFNMLKPDNYPATLTSVEVAFSNSRSGGVSAGSPFKILIFRDPEMDGPNEGQQPDLVFNVTANNPGNFELYTVPGDVTIDSGAFVVGVLDPIFVADLPAFVDLEGKVKPGSQSYFTIDNGKTFGNVAQAFPGFGLQPGTWMIRAIADVAGLAPVVNRAFYRKNKLRVIGRNFTDKAIVRINGKRVDAPVVFSEAAGKLTVKGSADDLNLNPSGQSNKLVIVVDGVASEPFEFTT